MGQVEGILRNMLRDLFEADNRGAKREKLARAHGYADGYMRALLDLGVAQQQDLLKLVLEERRRQADEPQARRFDPVPTPRDTAMGEALA